MLTSPHVTSKAPLSSAGGGDRSHKPGAAPGKPSNVAAGGRQVGGGGGAAAAAAASSAAAGKLKVYGRFAAPRVLLGMMPVRKLYIVW